VRQHVIGLRRTARSWARPCGPGYSWPAGSVVTRVAERLDGAEHQVDGRVRPAPLSWGSVSSGVREEALQHQQQDLVADVEQVHGLGGVIGSVASGTLVSRSDGLDVDRDHRPDRGRNPGLASRSCRYSSRIATKLAEMRGPPVPGAPPLALLQDLVDGPLRRGHVGDRDQFRPAEVLLGGLRPAPAR